MMGYGAGLGFSLGGWLVFLGWALVVIGVVVLIVWAVGRIGPGAAAAPSAPVAGDALEVLRLRFAKGEITSDEYLAAKQTLEAGR